MRKYRFHKRPNRKPVDILYRFWSRVDFSGNCWLWTGGRQKQNWYGQMCFGGRGNGNILTHRFSWIIHYGNIPIKKLVLHKCDNPICVNPKHLFLGTQKDNMRDMIKKKRHNNGGHQY